MNPTRRHEKFRASTSRSLIELTTTVLGYVALFAAAYRLWPVSTVGSTALAIAAGLVLVRVFVLQHDCAHRTLFAGSRTNDIAGTLLGVLTFAPHAYWRAKHLAHHATSGNLDRRGEGDIRTLTVREYEAASTGARLAYRIERHPIGLLVLGPVLQFVLRWRFASLLGVKKAAERRSILLTNLALAVLALAVVAFADVGRWLVIHAIVIQIAAGTGIWLFFVQHQMESPYWAPARSWSVRRAALEGSTALVLPRPIEILFGAINLHHVHHLRPDVPSYRVREFMVSEGGPGPGVRIGLADAIGAFRFKLYEESLGKMVGFPTISMRPALASASVSRAM